MPKKALRFVLFFDAKAQAFNPAAHNLPLDQAASFADELHSTDGSDCRILEQQTKHKKESAKECGSCKKAALAESKKLQAEQSQTTAGDSSHEEIQNA